MTGERILADLRNTLFRHLQKLSLKFHYQQQTGDLLFRVMADTFSIQGMVMNGPTPIMSIMLSAVALPNPTPRTRDGALSFCGKDDIL